MTSSTSAAFVLVKCIVLEHNRMRNTKAVDMSRPLELRHADSRSFYQSISLSVRSYLTENRMAWFTTAAPVQ